MGDHGRQRNKGFLIRRKALDVSDFKCFQDDVCAKLRDYGSNDTVFVICSNWAGKRCQTACKPGSVRPGLRQGGTAIPLGRALLRASRDQPGRRGGNALAPRCTASHAAPPATPIRSCSRWGLPCRPRCRRRGALLPHRFTLSPPMVSHGRRGGLFSVALSLGSPPPAINRHRFPVEPGLSSTQAGADAAAGAAAVRPSGTGLMRARGYWVKSHTARRARRVPESAVPVTASGRQWRWKARSTVAGSMLG